MALETPNYTQIPNEVFAVMHKMTPAELKVVLAVCRQTFGWHKQRDRISVSQLVVLTGLSRQGVLNGIDAAKEHGFLIAYEVGNSFEYEINVVEMVNEVDQSETENGQESRPASVNEVDRFAPKMVNEVDPQKKVFKETKKIISACGANVSISDSTKPEPENPITRTDEMAQHGNSHDLFFITQRSPAETLVRSWQLPQHLEDLSLEFVRTTGVMPRGGTKRSDKGIYAADAKDWLDAKFTVEDMQEAYQRCNGKFPITHLGALFRNVQENKRHAQPKADNDESANMVYIPGGQRVRAQ